MRKSSVLSWKRLTKEDVAYMIRTWHVLTTPEIATELCVASGTIIKWAAMIRKIDPQLCPKRKGGRETREVVVREGIKLYATASLCEEVTK